MENIDYDELSEKFKLVFLDKYQIYINQQIEEVNNSNFSIDISIYTSKTLEQSHNITFEFLKNENVQNHLITNKVRSFQFYLDFYLLMLTFEQQRKMDNELFHKIWLHNQNY